MVQHCMLGAVVLGPGCTRVTWRVCRNCMSSGLTPRDSNSICLGQVLVLRQVPPCFCKMATTAPSGERCPVQFLGSQNTLGHVQTQEARSPFSAQFFTSKGSILVPFPLLCWTAGTLRAGPPPAGLCAQHSSCSARVPWAWGRTRPGLVTLRSTLPAPPDTPSQSPEGRLLPNTFLVLLHARGWCTRAEGGLHTSFV